MRSQHPFGLALAAALIAAVASPALAEEDLPHLAVMDLQKGAGVSDDLASVVVATIARAARDTEAFSVISGADIRALLTLEAQKQLCGADSESCLSEIGGALGADFMVKGQLRKIGKKLVLDLVLMSVVDARRLNSVTRSVEGDMGSLVEEVPAATIELLSKALEGRLGTLVVSASEAGATVKVDGRIVGVSPLGAQKLPAGVHLLEVEKEGFITAKEQVVVKANETVARGVQLVPSPDFLAAYNRSARRMRLGAWISTGILAAALGTGAYFHLQADQAERAFKEKRAAYENASGGVTSSGPSLQEQYDQLRRLSADGKAKQTGSYVGYGIAGAAGLSALYFFIAGDDPGRYGGLASGGAVPGILVTPGGAYASLRVSF